MFLFRSAKIKKRMEKLWSFCAYHISEYEKQCSQSVPSALPDLKKQVWNMMESFSDEISTWDDNSVDYDTISRTLLSHSAFDLLTSGKYHISPGMLNPMSCAMKIKTVYELNMEYALETGELTKEEMEEQFRFLQKRIKEMG